jgi:hypothetical protein
MNGITGWFQMANDYSAGWFAPLLLVFLWVLAFLGLYGYGTKHAGSIASFLLIVVASLLSWAQLVTPWSVVVALIMLILLIVVDR